MTGYTADVGAWMQPERVRRIDLKFQLRRWARRKMEQKRARPRCDDSAGVCDCGAGD